HRPDARGDLAPPARRPRVRDGGRPGAVPAAVAALGHGPRVVPAEAAAALPAGGRRRRRADRLQAAWARGEDAAEACGPRGRRRRPAGGGRPRLGTPPAQPAGALSEAAAPVRAPHHPLERALPAVPLTRSIPRAAEGLQFVDESGGPDRASSGAGASLSGGV